MELEAAEKYESRREDGEEDKSTNAPLTQGQEAETQEPARRSGLSCQPLSPTRAKTTSVQSTVGGRRDICSSMAKHRGILSPEYNFSPPAAINKSSQTYRGLSRHNTLSYFQGSCYWGWSSSHFATFQQCNTLYQDTASVGW